MRGHASAAIVLLFTIAATAAASDAWLIRFSSYAAVPGFEGYSVVWQDDVLFFNTNAESVDVRLLGVSNGSMRPAVVPVTLPPGRVTSLNHAQQAETWIPTGGGSPATLYVVHVDIPSGVVVESRNQFSTTSESRSSFRSRWERRRFRSRVSSHPQTSRSPTSAPISAAPRRA